MTKIGIPDDMLQGLFGETSQDINPEGFLQIFEKVKDNPVLAGILSQGEKELREKVQKIAYAKVILTPEIYTEIGEEAISSPTMTLDKICTIGIGDPETIGLMDGGLTIEQIRAMTGEWLAHPGMTVDKITLLGFGATAEQIGEIGAENIAKMSQAELDQAFF